MMKYWKSRRHREKALALLLALTLILTLFPGLGGSVLATGTAEVEVGQATVAYDTAGADRTVSIPVEISSNPGVASYTLAISYDNSSLTLNSITQGPVASEGSFMTNITAEPGKAYVTCMGSSDDTNSGALFTLIFTVADEAAAGDYPITVGLKGNDPGNFCNAVPEPVPVTFTLGKITVSAPPAAEAATPTFITDLSVEPVSYSVGAAAATLTVEASVSDGGTISYQWYSNEINSSSGGTELSEETAASYIPATDSPGTTYYYAIATNTLGESTATAASSVAAVTVIEAEPGAAQTPSFDTNLSTEPVTYIIGASASALEVSASVSDGGTVSYQWYSNSENSSEGGIEISGATDASYIPSTAAAGTTYYYVVSTNTLGESTATATSNIVAVTVNAASSGWDGTTISQPATTEINGATYYQISSPEELAWFANLANGTLTDGTPQNTAANAILSADINLNNKAWTPIATYNSSNPKPFAGIFDGNGKKIYNLSVTATANYVSALFSHNTGKIKNLTIESGSISSAYLGAASLVSRNEGIVLNCLNKASVTSTRTAVGGLVGSGNGDYAYIVNSANCGSVTSTATTTLLNMGGILGVGDAYIINCYNIGNLESTSNKNRVGGIAGSGLNAKIVSSYNAGNVISTGTAIGGIVGYCTAANLSSGSALLNNTYFLKTASVNSGLEAVGDALPVTEAQARALDEAALAGSVDALGSAFAADTLGINGGYPVLAWQNTGVYPDPTEESIEGLAVTAVSTVSNGAITVTLDRELIFTKLLAGDFAATISLSGGASQSLPLTGITQAGTVVVLAFAPLSHGTSDHTVTVAVGYATGEKQSGSFTLYANPDWLIYAQKPAVGDGTADSPYRIGTAEELAWFAALVNGRLTDGTPKNGAAWAVLTADISLNDTSNWQSWNQDTEGLKYWTPIGPVSGSYYTGVFDGRGHTISGLYISDKNADFWYLGLFGNVSGAGAGVKNVNVADSYIYHNNNNKVGVGIGTIAGRTYQNTVENCSVVANLYVQGYYPYVGGILGTGSVSGCCFDGGVTLINTSYTASYTGGIVSSGTAINCYNRGTVGVSTSYTGGTSKEPDHAAGISGYSRSIANCYSTGSVTCTSGQANAVIGKTYDDTVVANSYYLEGMGSDSYTLAKTETEFTDGTVAGLLGEAYTTNAGINGGYPCLVWQTQGPGSGEANEVAAPVFALEGGWLSDTVTFKIACATEGATIHYTTDGTAPTSASTVYTEAGVTLAQGMVRTIAVKEGLEDSPITSESVIAASIPTITPGTCAISGPTTISIASVTPEVVIYYTTDGTSPLSPSGDALSQSAVQYTGGFTVSADTTVTAVALKSGMLKSGPSSVQYVCNWQPYAQQPATEGGIYLIGTPEELAWFAGLVNGTLSGVPRNVNAKAKLTANISLSGHIWTPIGTSDGKYAGTFDGTGHIVGGITPDNLVKDSVGTSTSNNGLFAYSSGTIKNLGIGGYIENHGFGFGAVCANNYGTIANCFNTADISSDHPQVGGICGINWPGGIIQYCYNTGTILGKAGPLSTSGLRATNVGGICGMNQGQIADCYNSGTLTCMYGTGYCWGNIVGDLKSTGTVTHCYSLGMMTEGRHREANYGDLGGWMSGAGSATLAGGSDTAVITDSYYLKDISLMGTQLDSVELTDLFQAYPSYSNYSYDRYGFAGYNVSTADAGKIDQNGTYYAFYDATNDRIIALKLEGAGDGGNVVIDAANPGGVSFNGTTGQYLSRLTKTFYVVNVPAATTHVKFINTQELQDFTFYLEDPRATQLTSGNAATALEQVSQTWRAAYDVIAAALINISGVAPQEPVEGQVHVIVENTTYPVSAGALWDGTLFDKWVEIDEESTMMDCVVAALNTVNATQTGAENNYIGSINGLGQFDGGQDSGWMGTLNDWFTHTGFGGVTVAAGTLEAGDEIRIMYSTNLGDDLGGTWDNNLKTVKAIAFSTGTLSPAFDKDTHVYTLTVPEEGTGEVIVTPTATNKNFQVHSYLGTQTSGTEYKRTATIPISDGSIINVVCGDPSWPSMNNGPYPGNYAENVPAETYTITMQGETEQPAGYTVGLVTADTDRNPGDTVSLNLNVDGSEGIDSYAALQTTVSYDKSRVSYNGSSLESGFTVTDNPSAGKLTITRVGASTATGSQGSLSFRVRHDLPAGSNEAVFSVMSALVGASGDPSDPEAAATGADVSVNVHNLTVSFAAGAHVSMDSTTAYARYGVAGLYTDNFYTTAFVEPIPTADSGYVLDSPLWNDGSGNVDYARIAATAFTANAVYTATATQDINVNITLPEQVTVISGVEDGQASYGTDVVFSVTPDPGQEIVSVAYTVGSGSPVILTAVEGVYAIPGDALTAGVIVTVTQKLSGTASFIGFDDYKGAPTGFKILKFATSPPEGYKYQYNDTDMYYSEKYQMFVCFMAADVDEENAFAGISCVAGTAPEINYDGNVNQSGAGLVNIIDAQLVYDLYTAVYLTDPAFETISRLMRLAADVNGDGSTDTSDVQIIVSLVLSQEG